MTWALVAGIVSFLVVPFLLPTESSGTKMARELAGPKDEFATLNGIDVRYRFEPYKGDCECMPPVLVLLHGFGASVFSWREVMEPLSEFGDVIAYDRPAFGLTERPTEWSGENPYGLEGNVDLLDAVVTEFGDGREIVLVGHSAGGLLAAEYTLSHPDTVSALVLVAPAILTTGGIPDGLEWLWGIPQIDRLGPVLVSPQRRQRGMRRRIDAPEHRRRRLGALHEDDVGGLEHEADGCGIHGRTVDAPPF